ncbi:hypothetical protein AWV80_08155 [Cupriavidus sp. UYMU48A]|nr:hypothetical protein AWV80_08155 [Cupriavidus sp. UYMU48A]
MAKRFIGIVLVYLDWEGRNLIRVQRPLELYGPFIRQDIIMQVAIQRDHSNFLCLFKEFRN